MSGFKDLTGNIFGRLTVVEKSINRAHNGSVLWVCNCVCGKTIETRSDSLRSGVTLSCGCYNKDIMTKHGQSYSSEYMVWASMKDRCTNSNSMNYSNYGARGISVCDRWLGSFENFYADMGPRPSDNHSIDRENNDGNYEPGNCRWATSKEQNNNTNRNVFYNYNNKQYSLEQLSLEVNLKGSTLETRINRGLNVEEAVNKPMGGHSGNTVIKIAKETGINPKTLYTRLSRGYSIEEAVKKG